MMRTDVTVQLVCDVAGAPDSETLGDWIDLTLAEVGVGGDRSREVSVRIVDDEEGRALNRRYRGVDRATNVLSFPAASPEAFASLTDDEPLPLGDLVLCAPLVAREAAEQGKVLQSHWSHLIVHGTLHLLGYDHERDADAREMEALEVRILGRRGVDNPYRERDSA